MMSTRSEPLNPVAAAPQAAYFGRLLDRVAGFDFFVSYAHADAQAYAEHLASQLRARGFRAFLDKHVYVAGEELHAATLRRVQASSKLIVVVGEQALQSHWVLQEVEAAIRSNRPVIAIDLLGDLAERSAQSQLAQRLVDRIHIREPRGAQAQTASEATLLALGRSFDATRRDARRLQLALAAIVFFALLAVFSYWQKNLADDRAEQYLSLCNDVVRKVKEGERTIDDLRISEFGRLIADVAATLARLPDPDKMSCVAAGG